MTTETRLTREQAAQRLGVGLVRLRSLARERGLTSTVDEFGTRTYSATEVDALVAKRSLDLPPSRMFRADAAKFLGVGIDRFNQLVREDPKRLGRRRVARGRSTYLRTAVEALKRRREGPRAPAYPKRGSAHTGRTRGQQ